MSTLTWYEYEAKPTNENEWHSTNLTADTIADLRKLPLVRTPYNSIADYNLRIVRKTLTTEVEL